MKMKTKNVIWRQQYWTVLGIVLLAALGGSAFTEYSEVKQLVKSIYPIEKVGVIARSVTFPQVLDQGRAIIDRRYPNASLLCMDVAYYTGLVTGLIWSMDRELVEEHRLHYLIDQASMAFFSCAIRFMPIRRGLPEEHVTTEDTGKVQVANADSAIAASPEMEEKTPVVSMEDVKMAVVPQIEKIQEVIRFAQTVKSKQKE
jgi:hypothetical protein